MHHNAIGLVIAIKNCALSLLFYNDSLQFQQRSHLQAYPKVGIRSNSIWPTSLDVLTAQTTWKRFASRFTLTFEFVEFSFLIGKSLSPYLNSIYPHITALALFTKLFYLHTTTQALLGRRKASRIPTIHANRRWHETWHRQRQRQASASHAQRQPPTGSGQELHGTVFAY